jgi:hypothetical protein
MSGTAPTTEQQDRARWDLLLLDIETRTEQLRHAKGYNPVEIEARMEQLRQLKTYEPRRLLIQGLTAGAALLGAGAALGALLVHLGR